MGVINFFWPVDNPHCIQYLGQHLNTSAGIAVPSQHHVVRRPVYAGVKFHSLQCTETGTGGGMPTTLQN